MAVHGSLSFQLPNAVSDAANAGKSTVNEYIICCVSTRADTASSLVPSLVPRLLARNGESGKVPYITLWSAPA